MPVHLLGSCYIACQTGFSKSTNTEAAGSALIPDSSFYPRVTITCAIQALCTSRQCLLDHLGCGFVCSLNWGREGRNFLKCTTSCFWATFIIVLCTWCTSSCSPKIFSYHSASFYWKGTTVNWILAIPRVPRASLSLWYWEHFSKDIFKTCPICQ